MAGNNSLKEAGGTRSSWINQIVGDRYEVLEWVGEGALLWVYRVRDQSQNRVVALKLLRSDLPEGPILSERLREGVSESMALAHSGISRIYEVGVEPKEGGAFYLVEEFVRGLDLAERIRRTAPFSLNVATDVAVGIAEALEYAHQRGMTHGDLRPEHVLVQADNAVKVSGFGEGLALRRLAALRPEAATGEAGPPSVASDLQALATLLYHMLAGELPRPGADGAVSLRTINQAIPRALEGIVRKGLHAAPELRYRSASELLVDLRAVKDSLRLGRSLSWSPLDAEPTPSSAAPKTQEIMPSIPEVKRRRVSKTASSPEGDDPAGAEKRPVKSRPSRSGIGRWFVTFNIALVLALAALAYSLVTMITKIMVPPGEVVVPNLVGKSFEEAEALGRKMKFEVVEFERKNRNDYPGGAVYMQREQAGMKVKEDQKVYVGVSDGPVMVVVPGVTEMTLEKASKMLDKEGLRRGEVTYKFDTYIAKGNVLEQDPPSGERRPKGAPIGLTVSKGEEPTPVPTPEPTPEPIPDPVIESPPPVSGGKGSDEGFSPPVVHTYNVPETPYNVANDGKPHRIRIDVIDESGKHTEYDNMHSAGDPVQVSVTVTGKGTIRLYDNDHLQGESPSVGN